MEIGSRVFDLAIWNNTAPRLERSHFVLEPDHMEDHHIFDFKNADTLYQKGYDVVMRNSIEIIEKYQKLPI